MRKVILLSIILVQAIYSKAQTNPFDIYIESLSIPSLGGIQAYAFGQSNGKILLIGGRLDGLHRRQPFAAFDIAGNNNQLIVIDPVLQQKWTASISSLNVSLQEQLSSTNMEFHQDGNYLYIIGGYGYNTSSASRKTFDQMIAIDVSSTINAVVSGSSIVNYFRQISHPDFAVTGGHLKKINDTYYLIGGNKFDGNYNPMGGATYTQEYTNAIRKFKLSDDGINLTITHLPALVNSQDLHRRDYNAVPQILPNGDEGITAFSGVFQTTVDLPYLNCVEIDSLNYTVNNTFQQYYNHYHCAVLPLYSATANEMHSVFFGGIAQYYDSAGIMVQDNNVPFVKTIARVTRNASSVLSEFKLPIEMPNYLGASAEFIPLLSVPHYNNEVMKLDQMVADSTLVGYIFGGISSTAPNIFFTNTGSQSEASNMLYKVYVLKSKSTGLHELNNANNSILNLQIFPNPGDGDLAIKFNLKEQSDVRISLFNMDGKILNEQTLHGLQLGDNQVRYQLSSFLENGTFLIRVETSFETVTRKVILER